MTYTARGINIKNYDKVVFLGDYVDSFTISNIASYENLKDIIRLKKRDPNKVVLLLGNHDIQYGATAGSGQNGPLVFP